MKDKYGLDDLKDADALREAYELIRIRKGEIDRNEYLQRRKAKSQLGMSQVAATIIAGNEIARGEEENVDVDENIVMEELERMQEQKVKFNHERYEKM